LSTPSRIALTLDANRLQLESVTGGQVRENRPEKPLERAWHILHDEEEHLNPTFW